MFQFRRAMKCAVGAMLLILSISPAANAQTAQSWIPKLTRGQHVFVAPEIDSATRAKFTSPSFQSEVDNAGRSQNLDVYVIVTQTANDVGPVGSSGPALVRAVWTNWTNHGFVSNRALIILMTGTGGKFSSIGVRAGQYLNDRGINRDSLSADTGPVITAGRAYITNDYRPERVPAAIVQGVVQAMGPVVKANFVSESPRVSEVTITKSSNNGEGSMDSGTTIMLIAGVVLVGGFLLIVFWPRKRRDFESEVRNSASRGSTYGGSTTPSGGYGSSPARGSYGSSPSPSSPAPSSSHSDNSTSNMLLGGIIGYELGRSNSESHHRSSGSDSASAPAAVTSTPASSCTSSSSSSSSSCSSSTSSSSCSSSSSSSCSSSSGGSSCGGGGSSCGGGGSF